MENLFEWKFPELSLDEESTEVLAGITVQSYARKNGEIKASGFLHGICYLDGGEPWDIPWEAWGIRQQDSLEYEWQVNNTEDFGDEEFARDPEEWQGLFCQNLNLNQALEGFILMAIEAYQIRGGPGQVGPVKYPGARITYKGRCVCHLLVGSGLENPFPWYKLTKGFFPQDCFSCSCGRKWWLYNRRDFYWLEVADYHAWEMLIDYNGTPVKTIRIMGDRVFLAQTLCNQAFIDFNQRPDRLC